MEFIGKKYKMISSENFDEFMKVIGEYIHTVIKYFLRRNRCRMPAGILANGEIFCTYVLI